jgi:hypothetical protein
MISSMAARPATAKVISRILALVAGAGSSLPNPNLNRASASIRSDHTTPCPISSIGVEIGVETEVDASCCSSCGCESIEWVEAMRLGDGEDGCRVVGSLVPSSSSSTSMS